MRAFNGLTGDGVKVGALSDGADARTSARSWGDLPSGVEINPNDVGEGHEGTALMEIVHDIAPNAEPAFSGAGSSLEMARAILWLANDASDKTVSALQRTARPSARSIQPVILRALVLRSDGACQAPSAAISPSLRRERSPSATCRTTRGRPTRTRTTFTSCRLDPTMGATTARLTLRLPW